VTELSLLLGAEDDPLLAGLPTTVRAIESHQDQITRLPADAVPLMSSERCRHQMLRIGRSWGVQFHPEVTPDRLRDWNTDTLRSWGFSPAEVLAEAERREDELERTWSAVFGRFLDVAASSETGESATFGP
jgi:GMP synthase (glutamine-hydrolysing)